MKDITVNASTANIYHGYIIYYVYLDENFKNKLCKWYKLISEKF